MPDLITVQHKIVQSCQGLAALGGNAPQEAAMRKLYYGDNLKVMREHLPGSSVDLVYLDPPFNSNRVYNLLFRDSAGGKSDAQATAFEDMWEWGEQAERELAEIKNQDGRVGVRLTSLKGFLDDSPMMAYLVMMGNRLLEMRRVMKDTSSLYLHCDVKASHYLKILLDAVFGERNFRNEIIWQYGKFGRGTKTFPKNFDQILFYTKSDSYTFHPPREPRTEPRLQLVRENVNGVLKNKRGPDGSLLYQESTSKKIESVWQIPGVAPASREYLPYPTQKPVRLLERIIKTSTDPGDIVLDPFCGCGTAVHAAEKEQRSWIGIDVTSLAINIIENRMQGIFPGIRIELIGIPEDLDGARALALQDKYEFQQWACRLVGARGSAMKKGRDRGIDGVLRFHDDESGEKAAIISVKAGNSVGPAMIRELAAVVAREHAEFGVFICLANPTAATRREGLGYGMYEVPRQGRTVPRIQIRTIEQLLRGDKPDIVNLDPSPNLFQTKPHRKLLEQQQLAIEESPAGFSRKQPRKARVVKLHDTPAKSKRRRQSS